MDKKEKINDILEKGTEDVIDKNILRKKLESGERLRIKLGVDPTGKKIHLGRAFQFWKLKDFQDLGHKIILIVGDFTARIGDASDKEAMRKPLTEKEIKDNMKGYLEQIGKIIDIEKTEVKYNSEWFSKMTVEELISLAMNFTAQQLIVRRNFKERWDSDKPIGLHEIIYPLLQGYDSVKVKADVEIGGFDQLFNLKAGRKLQKIFNQEPQQIITSKMLYGLDGRKMSTSWGNVVNITDNPKDMYGKIMSLKDELILDYFYLCAFYPDKKIKELKERLKIENPKNIKKELATKIVSVYYDNEKAKIAEREFEKVFENKELPEIMPEKIIKEKNLTAIDLIYVTGFVGSKSDSKRLIEQGGARIDGKAISDWKEMIKIKNNMVVQVGKRKFIKIIN